VAVHSNGLLGGGGGGGGGEPCIHPPTPQQTNTHSLCRAKQDTRAPRLPPSPIAEAIEQCPPPSSSPTPQHLQDITPSSPPHCQGEVRTGEGASSSQLHQGGQPGGSSLWGWLMGQRSSGQEGRGAGLGSIQGIR
jgi:hypothetical protein